LVGEGRGEKSKKIQKVHIKTENVPRNLSKIVGGKRHLESGVLKHKFSALKDPVHL